MANTELERATHAAHNLFRSHFPRQDDFTLLIPNPLLAGIGRSYKFDDENWWRRYCYKKVNIDPDDDPHRSSFEFTEILTDGKESEPARLQVSRAYEGKAWSVTVRWRAPTWQPTDPRPVKLAMRDSSWRPATDLNFGRKPLKEGGYDTPLCPFLLSIDEVVRYLHDGIVDDCSPPHHGLILVTGGTNSSKSLIARGLAWRFLHRATRTPPHLVTFEDPIEQLFWEDQAIQVLLQSKDAPPRLGLDYTPRQVSSDCKDLKEALTASLRQTPSVFYIGEIREEDDLRQAVEFGGTGHLAIATAHAGNLLEAMAKIFKAVGARRAGTRAVFAPKVLAVIHLTRHIVDVKVDAPRGVSSHSVPLKLRVVMPTIYRRTALGLQTLVADGLAALLPHCPDSDTSRIYGSLGKRFFLQSLSAALGEGVDAPHLEDAEAKALHDRWPDVRQHVFSGPQPDDGIAADSLLDLALEDDLYGR